MSGVQIQTQGLALQAAARRLLDGLDWQVRAGEHWCVIGRNGAGKSLLLRALAGLHVPQRQGQVHWQGRDQHDWPVADAARARAYMPQQPQDRFALSVQRVLELSTVGPATEARQARPLLAALDVADLAARRIDQLSGGERQRVALAQCAAQGAAVMLLDEPVSFQDPAHQQLVGRWLRAAPGTWVASAHDPAWIGLAATHVLALTGGGRWRAGPVAEILSEEILEATYGCPWRQIDGVWLAR